MSYSKVTAVSFDAADTLFYIRDGLGRTYAQLAGKYGVNPSPEELKASFSRHFPKAPPLAFNTSDQEERKKLEKNWWYNVVHDVYKDVGMFESFNEYFNDLFEVFRTQAWKIFPETRQVLSELKSRGYKIIVVSNFDSRVYDVCRNLEISQYFDDFVISSEAGYAKPSVEIFKISLKRRGLQPDQCVHIGDNFANDYICPTTLGMKALFLDREGTSSYGGSDKIKDLKQVVKKLGDRCA